MIAALKNSSSTLYLLLFHGEADKCAHANCNRIIQSKVTEPKTTFKLGCSIQFRKFDDHKNIQKQKQIRKLGCAPVENHVRSSSESPQALDTQKEI